tara:strand:- start:405 stop:1727 length:1323 start_codon:yes stop_codon:yes gene_type:complete
MNIAVIGTGYVGLVTGTCFAETGNQVTCIDIDAKKIEMLNGGELPIYEPDLDVLYARNRAQGRLTFTTDLAEGIAGAELIMLALPTPPDEDGSADLSHILAVAEDLGRLLTEYRVIVTKSTVPVGTADLVREAIAGNAKTDFDVVSNPEFLREGFAVSDFMKPERIVIGTSSDRARRIMERLTAPFVRQGNPVIYMDERSAEMTKYAANAFLAMKISYMNEIANLCERIGADVDHVRRGIGTDNRIGKRFLFPGIGYGGSCFPKDVQALARMASEAEYSFDILDAVMRVNQQQKTVLIPRIEALFGSDLADKKFAIWGLAFKPNTDDIREAPSLFVIEELRRRGAAISVYDPEAMENVKPLLGDEVEYAENYYAAVQDADAIVIVTEWAVFRNPDFKRIAEAMKSKVIFDGRNLYEVELMRELGFHYESVGRKGTRPDAS